MDWNAIKIDYITGKLGYRALAKKHGVPFTTLAHRASVEGWVELRQRHNDEIVTKTCKNAAKEATDYRDKLYSLALKVAQQLEDMTDQNSVSSLAAAGIKPRDITGAIKDLEDILHIKSENDLKEQEARIAKLRKEVESGNEDTSVKVIIAGDAEELAE